MSNRSSLGGRNVHAFRAAVSLVVALLLCATTIVPAFAAGGEVGNISGTIIDAQTKTPVANAQIALAAPSGSFSAKTNSAGFFTILGVTVDTYVLSVSASGFDALTIPGITVPGDQTLSLGNLQVTKHLQTIGRVTARSTNGAFQPTQTTDSYTVSGARIIQTVGKTATTNENNLLLAVPGVTLSNAGIPSIRGGGSREVGYQYDGVTFTEPFLSNNGSNGLINGVGNVQVVEGAGDATQGGVGSGVINIVPKRGAYPGFGYVDLEAGGPNFSHQAAMEYGFATPNGRFSDYITYNGQRFVPYFGNSTTNVAAYNNYFANSYQANDQFTNNFVYKFGKNNNQSLQVLYTNISQQAWGNAGGIPTGSFPTNPNSLVYYPFDTLGQATWIGFGQDFGMSQKQYGSYIGLQPYTPGFNRPIDAPQQNASLQTRFLKFEYDNSLSANTYVALRYYNWEQLQDADTSYSLNANSGGPSSLSVWQSAGGPTVGMSFDLTQQVGSKLTVNFNAKYDDAHPILDVYQPQLEMLGLALSGFGAANPDGVAGPSPADWLPGGYLSKYFAAGQIPRIPTWGINYQKSLFQNWGSGIRFQYNPIHPLKFDLGIRYEGQNQQWNNQLEQYGQGPPGYITKANGPFDVPASFWQPSVLQPREWEPRLSVAYQLDPNDAVRFAYGRSAVFGNAQSTGTPFTAYNINPYLKIPPVPGFQCGIPTVKLFPCQSYGEQLYWLGDQIEAPDAGNGRPALYSNYDVSYSHQFKDGLGFRLTPFYKVGQNLPTFALATQLPGGGGIFAASNYGFNRTTGVEASLTTPDHPIGFSGFLSATYQNVLSTTPPLSTNETNVPSLQPATLALGDLYRAGYISPFSVRIGGTYALKSGFSATPTIQYNIGYPYSVGNLIAATVGPNQYANIPQVDFGAGVPTVSSIGNITGAGLSTNYYDPAYSGSQLHPNIAASRGTPATAANGGYLSTQNVNAALVLQYKKHGNIVGVQIANLFGNAFNNTVPSTNPYYQPVANGLSGPQTNYNFCAAPSQGFKNLRGCEPQIPNTSNAFANGAYLLSNGNFTNAPLIAPLRPMTLQVYYQHVL